MGNTADDDASAAVESWSCVYPLKAVVTEAEPAAPLLSPHCAGTNLKPDPPSSQRDTTGELHELQYCTCPSEHTQGGYEGRSDLC